MDGFLLLCLNLCAFVWTWVRETPSFWHDPSVPQWMQEVTATFYYPSVGLLGAVLLSRFLAVCRRRWPWNFVAYNLAALVLLGCVGLAGANNLSNWMDGRPLHWHQGEFSSYLSQ